jgi:hypothetical protein
MQLQDCFVTMQVCATAVASKDFTDNGTVCLSLTAAAAAIE